MIAARQLAPGEWRLWRDLRLRALEDAPWAFGSTLAEIRDRDTEVHWREGVTWPRVPFVAEVDQEAVELPAELVSRYRAVDREFVGSPTFDTPAHLDALQEQISRDGMRTPIDLAFHEKFATIDGNHRIAVALRLGMATVPVHLTRRAGDLRPAHARDMHPGDLMLLEAALSSTRTPRATSAVRVRRGMPADR